jgi:diacylglycerol kinase (ATP)
MRRSDLLAGFEHAFAGIWHVVRTQRNARIHLGVALLVIGAGAWLGLAPIEWAVLALTIGMVLAAEWFNTVAETVVDLMTLEDHPLAKVAKDAAAAAVLLTAMVAVVVGLLILGIPAWRMLSALLR